jgi:cellulose synthase/poly-beta-1,6-N-acetylglucosamine synthase-like glycosyltransferase
MFSTDGYIWTALHFIALGGLSLYGMHRLWLLACWRREGRKRDQAIATSFLSGQAGRKLPVVTVQLPLYNERFVAERLLNAAACLDWPKERLEIQILDDSTDDTRKIVDEKSDYWRKKGIDVKVLRRGNREGYKAGALNYGLTLARGEYFAVFDADFLPCPDFLHRTLPFFSDKKMGMAQARWGFLNAGHSWLTGIQSLLLGPHFSIEHWVRYRRGLFFNFNGTAGIWRRKAIESAGGWQYDTVTEDLDLSYRAQLAGWRFVYLDDLVIPSELPVTKNTPPPFFISPSRSCEGRVFGAPSCKLRLAFGSDSDIDPVSCNHTACGHRALSAIASRCPSVHGYKLCHFSLFSCV